METRFLLPHRAKTMGWLIFIPSLLLGVIQFFSTYEPKWLDAEVPALFYTDWLLADKGERFLFFTLIQNNLADEICALLLLIGGLLLVFAREVHEDEMIMKIRLESMLWSARVNGIVILFCIIFIYDITFYYVMVLNLFLLFFLFIGRFEWALRSLRRESE
ncbi:MAG: hypothetical protein RLP14_03105 [Owenweeksia sp.]